jgi:hypothetical protein
MCEEEHLERFYGLLPESQGQHQAVSGLYVSSSLDSGQQRTPVGAGIETCSVRLVTRNGLAGAGKRRRAAGYAKREHLGCLVFVPCSLDSGQLSTRNCVLKP